MFFVTFEYNGLTKAGVLTKDHSKIIALGTAEEYFFGTNKLDVSLLEIVKHGEELIGKINEIISNVDTNDNYPFLLQLEEVTLKAPIPRPEKDIFCLGKNYKEHALEFEKTKDESIAVPKYPVIFSKSVTSVNHPGEAIFSHQGITTELDYEAELAVVIGKRGTNIPKENVMDHIFGFTIINDVTARDLQKKHSQWYRGKSLDTFAPMGPYLVHKSSVPNYDNLDIKCTVNGEIRQNSNTSKLIFDIPTTVSVLSDGMTLEAGDIIATGTPSGVGMGFNPPKFLQPGDSVEVEISGIGILRNTVI
ncbi:fumarylacetoacetate hydrolase family protein [Bacillus sp. ISL-45]|uniref:fumarylacetoacetate hydrolase family protein n=1 Tax=Bacillus sp. ISL-45 TaxID=2819128 RepID=UPI001BE95D56|nr:fumarylacetoacetate hydrolase family protein [Bacillus sp. ISL-45]MBT2661647.1 fumarylacetoacetate hydrolase family protein [Bacillus sp. ISL-45]